MYHNNSTAKYFGGIQARNIIYSNLKLVALEIRPPIYTTNKERGYRGTVSQTTNPLLRCRDVHELCEDTNKQTRVVIHSPYEMLDPYDTEAS